MGSGPDAFREAGIAGELRSRGAELAETTLSLPEGFVLEVGSAFRLNREIAKTVQQCVNAGEFPILFSGNCHASVGALSGQQNKDCIVIWYDRHGDYNTPDTSPSGYMDGMSLAILTGRCWSTAAGSIPGYAPISDRNVLLLGAHDIDPGERQTILQSGATWLMPEDFRTPALEQSILSMKKFSSNAHIHLDLDVLDVAEVPANQYSGSGGISVAELLQSISLIRSQFNVQSLTIAAYNPSVDPDKKAIACVRALLQTLFPS